ncbi:MAG: ribosome small subunit-dependent GTPase A [Clostridiales bacterium]|jgi:ribosome biogenesis GTPase|nr:ribosome small subunit-dependent GTPase A [Clostridiales bacterium]
MTEEIRGIILKGVGGLYGVRPDRMQSTNAQDLILCNARGLFRHESITPLPGDEVLLQKVEDTYVIQRILTRRNSLIRPALANLSHLFVVLPAANPKPDLLMADKLISAAEDKEINPVIIINKIDMSCESAAEITKVYTTGGFTVFPLSCATGEGVDALHQYIAEESSSGRMTAAFSGVSGAGKSTLMSVLFPNLQLKTGEISRKIKRGRHTTRHAELYPVEREGTCCYIADTPGFSMLDFARYHSITPEDLPYTFREFVPCIGTCRYTKCTHTKEEGCAVLEKMAAGELSPLRHAHYCSILEEIKKNPPWKREQSERK